MTRKPENTSVDTDPIQAISVSPSQSHVALASRNDIKILNILTDGLSEQCTLKLDLKSRDNFTITDVSWSARNQKFLAASANNGSVVVFNINDKRQLWSSIESTCSVNKINWSPLHDDILISCFQDGSIKLFDIRDKKKCSQTTFSTRSESCRDVRFNNFNQNIFAAVYENGNLIVWDRRKLENPQSYLTKLSAHTTSGLSLSWNPYNENIVATGSRDRSVKVWDLNSVNLTEPRPIHLVHTLSSVNYLAWRPGSSQWASQIATASSSESQIFIWNLSLPNVPACILRGLNDPCSGLAWLDTPILTTNSSSNSSTTDHANNSFKGTWQHILTSGKNGQLILQDLRNGHFPRQHMAASTVSLSVCGDIAMHYGTIIRSDILGLTPPPPPSSISTSYTTSTSSSSNSSTSSSLRTTFNIFEKASNLQFQKMINTLPPFSHLRFPSLGGSSTSREESGIETSDTSDNTLAVTDLLGGIHSNITSATSSDEKSIYENSNNTSTESTTTSTSQIPNPNNSNIYSDSEVFAKPSSLSSDPVLLLDPATGTTKEKYLSQLPLISITAATSSRTSSAVSAPLSAHDAHKSLLQPPTQGRLGYILFREGSIVRDFRKRRNAFSHPKDRGNEEVKEPREEGVVDVEVVEEEEEEEEEDLVDGTLDPCTIRRLALGYVTKGAWREVCETNTVVAQDISMIGHAILWESLLIILPGIIKEAEVTGAEKRRGGIEELDLEANITSLVFLPMMQDLLMQLLDHGDCQHFVIICELLKKEKITPAVLSTLMRRVPETRRKEAYFSYWELLHRLQLPVLASQLCVHSDIPQLAERSKHNVDMKHCCSRCGRSTPEAVKHGQEWCKSCKVNNSLCVLCHRPVGGLLLWCPVCGHGGHKECIQKWFFPHHTTTGNTSTTTPTSKAMRTCPAACGHECIIPSVHANPIAIRPGKNQRGGYLSSLSYCELSAKTFLRSSKGSLERANYALTAK